MLRQSITRTVNGNRITIGHGTITLIATRRESARSALRAGSARDNAFILRDLRDTVADQVGISKADAHYLLASIKYAQLFV